ncbi:hypothetical protein JX265_001774 [Neoarthrinium moseri]|uniref:Uncharacterized protein n=1 Tax=Neoarthrinium moseri TaxID=1658444 RepID=A0A9P9WW29_9PEZI|nr:hypothetical protein JX266_011419 [Neoarthrinium moseri]KAI1880153.1 hypothetical protein JX265_001774 [Neoarthrinium moseri]
MAPKSPYTLASTSYGFQGCHHVEKQEHFLQPISQLRKLGLLPEQLIVHTSLPCVACKHDIDPNSLYPAVLLWARHSYNNGTWQTNLPYSRINATRLAEVVWIWVWLIEWFKARTKAECDAVRPVGVKMARLCMYVGMHILDLEQFHTLCATVEGASEPPIYSLICTDLAAKEQRETRDQLRNPEVAYYRQEYEWLLKAFDNVDQVLSRWSRTGTPDQEGLRTSVAYMDSIITFWTNKIWSNHWLGWDQSDLALMCEPLPDDHPQLDTMKVMMRAVRGEDGILLANRELAGLSKLLDTAVRSFLDLTHRQVGKILDHLRNEARRLNSRASNLELTLKNLVTLEEEARVGIINSI